MTEELWMEVRVRVHESGIKRRGDRDQDHPQQKEMKKRKLAV